MTEHTPRRVVCLTEESVETLYLLGLEDRIVGVSSYVKRPPEAMSKKKVTSFIKANDKAILELEPDLVVGYSDIQKDIAQTLVGQGLSVWIANHRSLDEICDYVVQLGSLFGKRDEALELVATFEKKKAEASQKAANLSRRPRVYFEEWDEPMISGIKWVSEAIELAGGVDVCSETREGKLATDRTLNVESLREKNPEIFFGCWCGKKFDADATLNRIGASMQAAADGQLFELEPEVFLQPGPAIFLDGLPELSQRFEEWAAKFG